MSSLILQPCGSKDAKQHYIDTIDTPVALSSIKKYITSSDYDNLSLIYPSGGCFIWGVTPTKTNFKKWNRIKRGDVAIFSSDGRIFSTSITTYKLHSKDLAKKLWGVDKNDNTWEYIYFLSEIKKVHIPYINFNRTIKKIDGDFYKDNFIIQGFDVLSEDRCRIFFDTFDLESDVINTEINKEAYENAIELLLTDLSETDREIKSKNRLEQSYLKQLLFGFRNISDCACCGKSYPVSYLVTAHIKKRNKCTLEERTDRNIVFPMCKFGCDELFERGYISVKNGKFTSLGKTPITSTISNFINSISGNNCSFYNSKTKEYFDWHYNYHNK